MLLLEKLRNYVEHHAMNDAERVLVTEAADELERLQKEEVTLAEIRLWMRKINDVLN